MIPWASRKLGEDYMGAKKYQINLSGEERNTLTKIIKTGKSSARSILRANILLQSDAAAEANDRSEACRITTNYDNNRSKCAEELCRAWRWRNSEPQKTGDAAGSPKVDGELEARIIALCCSEPPAGYARWNLRLLADKCVELGYVDAISHPTIDRTLKKTNVSLIWKNAGVGL